MNKTPVVTVIGSINMDLTVTTKKIPNKGETILGESFSTLPGGKGANQAVAAARLGAKVNLIGALGDDAFGTSLLDTLKIEGINTHGISIEKDVSTGIATILVSDNDNRIIVTPGANYHVSPALVERYKELIMHSDVVLLQLEIPLETVEYTTHLCKENHIPVVINPAPYQKLPRNVVDMTTYLTPNELEVEEMKNDYRLDAIKEKVIITKGSAGVNFYKDGAEDVVPAFQVDVEDTTGAGDTFNGAFATRIALGSSIEEAIQFANAAAALSVTKFGAQGGMPTAQQVENFLQERSI
ncbi:ribokinase [Ornithinibacillus scapharcae]|uniref:ribokinase n=1 Tax=Ornithinibacillus scapharcae TaxID=1147159 RepID=UPI000225B876|nr:ribokinase [Ornithinibacillus scapharcae]